MNPPAGSSGLSDAVRLSVRLLARRALGSCGRPVRQCMGPSFASVLPEGVSDASGAGGSSVSSIWMSPRS